MPNKLFFSQILSTGFRERSVYSNALDILMELERMYGLHSVYWR